MRELAEETGLSAQLIEDFESSISFKYVENNQLFRKNVTYFTGKTDAEDVRISDEHQDYCWKTYLEARDLMSYPDFPETRHVLDSVETFLNK